MLPKCPLISCVCKNSIKSELSKSVCVQIFMRLDDLLVPQSELLLDFEMAAKYLGILQRALYKPQIEIFWRRKSVESKIDGSLNVNHQLSLRVIDFRFLVVPKAISCNFNVPRPYSSARQGSTQILTIARTFQNIDHKLRFIFFKKC